jgi:hypothetical protein
MRVIEAGHIYALRYLDPLPRSLLGLLRALSRWWRQEEVLVFRRRSSKMVDYGDGEHDGTNTQELIRTTIDLCKVAQDRSEFLDHIQSCNETRDAMAFFGEAIADLRLALYSYEVRAYRRKQAKLNKEAGKHDDQSEPTGHGWRDGFEDVPFTCHEIEDLPIGPDGHLLIAPDPEVHDPAPSSVQVHTGADHP